MKEVSDLVTQVEKADVKDRRTLKWADPGLIILSEVQRAHGGCVPGNSDAEYCVGGYGYFGYGCNSGTWAF